MPSKKPERRLQDILENGRAILRYTSGMSEESFAANRMVVDAVERCFERITEAVVKLGDEAQLFLPNQPANDIRALGNRLRHNYDEIAQHRLWQIVQNDLLSLLNDSEAAIRALDEREGR